MESPHVERCNQFLALCFAFTGRSALLSQEEQLEGKDLAVTKMSINMGKTSNDALGRVNPVERMLFYHKGNLQVGEKVFNAVVS